MVRINRNELVQKDLDSLFLQFDILLGKLNSNATSTLLNELFGREERITFAKRLAAIILLNEGTSEYKTAQVLKLSPTTTGKISDGIAHGMYSGTLALLRKNKKDYAAILEKIDSILHFGGILPHRIGLDRYRNLNNRPPRIRSSHFKE